MYMYVNRVTVNKEDDIVQPPILPMNTDLSELIWISTAACYTNISLDFVFIYLLLFLHTAPVMVKSKTLPNVHLLFKMISKLVKILLLGKEIEKNYNCVFCKVIKRCFCLCKQHFSPFAILLSARVWWKCLIMNVIFRK